MRFVRYAATAAILTLTRCGVQQTQVGDAPAPADAHQVVIWEYKFKPQVLTVPVGTTVSWINRDMTPHTATHKTFGDEPFDTGDLTSGDKWSHTFKTPGTYAYLCMLHQGMTGTIIVQ